MCITSFINEFDCAEPLLTWKHHVMLLKTMPTNASPSDMLPLMNEYDFFNQQFRFYNAFVFLETS